MHYVSFGTPGGEYGKECRAAIITAAGTLVVARPGVEVDSDAAVVDLAVLNPTGMFFNQGCAYDDGGEAAGSPDCPSPESHGSPFRYCSCGWREASFRGGTWHWPERFEE